MSLLHYFGLLSIRDVREGALRLAIPNQTVRRLMYGYLRDGYRDIGVFSVDLYILRAAVARDGVPRRVAPGAGVHERGDCRPDLDPRLHRRRKDN